MLGGARRRGCRAVAALDFSEPVDTGAFYKNLLRPALEAVRLPATRPATKDAPSVQGVRLHDLRHTFATHQLSSGVHFMPVSKWLGHSTFTLTLDVYGDYIPEGDGGAVKRFARASRPGEASRGGGEQRRGVVWLDEHLWLFEGDCCQRSRRGLQFIDCVPQIDPQCFDPVELVRATRSAFGSLHRFIPRWAARRMSRSAATRNRRVPYPDQRARVRFPAAPQIMMQRSPVEARSILLGPQEDRVGVGLVADRALFSEDPSREGFDKGYAPHPSG